jgi:hypothetical protein
MTGRGAGVLGLPGIVCAVLAFGCASVLLAQDCHPGEVRIYVKDTLEGPVFQARVRLGSAAKEIGEFTTRTEGVADFANVPCGSWTATVTKAGFEDGSISIQTAGEPSIEKSIALSPKIVHVSTEVTDSTPHVEQSASENNELRPEDVKTLPSNPATVADALPLVPGVARTPQGELLLDGSGEQRSAFVVNQSDVTDPATGKFGQTVPLDAIETVNVLNVPFLAQYGRFTQTVVAVETRRGGDKWHADLNDPFPDFRIRSYHMRGIANETPRFVFGGPLIKNRLYFNSAFVYVIDKVPSRTLGFPFNESKKESINSFTQLDYILSPNQILTGTAHISPQHTNFINPDYFNPQPVTPSYAQQSYVGTLAHHFGIFNGTLDSSISVQRFNAYVGAQGSQDMALTPTGNEGNFFGVQKRDARREEWLENWTPKLLKFAGTHQTRIGSSLTFSGSEGRFSYRPVNILNTAGQELQRITFSDPGAYSRSDSEATAYVQDHWTVNPRISFDYGARVEHQRLASSLRIAPRAGFAWSPFANERTVVRFGWGEFYDHIPLDVYAFSRYPARTITNYAPDGSIVGMPLVFENVIGSVTGPKSFFIRGEQVAGAFSPRGTTYNAQIEHTVSRMLRLRAVYLDNRSVGLVSVEPQLSGTTNEILLNGDGSSHYRQLELSAKVTWKADGQLMLSYVHSRDRGTLSDFDNFIGNFPTPVIRPITYSNLPGDLPNRFLAWGRVNPHVWGLTVMPIVEYRNGFPYAAYDSGQNYVGIPYSGQTRFRNFFSADARLVKDFKVNPKYTLRLSLAGFNLTNHFNPLLVHSNIADPRYGTFFGNYKRRYRFDFEVIF